MIITDTQRKSLVELIAIAFTRTAASLSTLVGAQVSVGTPKLRVLTLADALADLSEAGRPPDLAVTQRFSGVLAGTSVLALDVQSAGLLVGLLTGESPATRLNEASREVLLEVGTSLLSACVNTLSSVGGARVSFAAPQFYHAAPELLARAVADGAPDLQLGMVMGTTLQVRGHTISARMLIVISLATLDHIARGIAPVAVMQ
ncbi:MAG: hypothetical protein OHK0015_55120 [Chloroflexi bacterium OHK40]